MPQLFGQEILFDFKKGAVINITPADGLLAQAALHARIPYTGLVFARRHADELLHELQFLVIARATREGGTWYDQHLVASLATLKPKAKDKPKQTSLWRQMPGNKSPKARKCEACSKVLTHRKGIQDG